MFVIAPPPSDEGEQIDCEPGDLDVDMDGLDQEINEDSFLAEESTEELKGALSTTEDEDENLYDPAEITGVDEVTAETQPAATTPGQLEVCGNLPSTRNHQRSLTYFLVVDCLPLLKVSDCRQIPAESI